MLIVCVLYLSIILCLKMQVQFKKTNRNMHIITDLIERSFAMRRAEIIDNNMYLDQIFTKFPFLQEADTVSHCYTQSDHQP